MPWHTASGQWAVEFLQRTATLPRGREQCNSCNAPPHCLGAVNGATLNNALPRRLGAVVSATPATHCLTAWGSV